MTTSIPAWQVYHRSLYQPLLKTLALFGELQALHAQALLRLTASDMRLQPKLHVVLSRQQDDHLGG